MYHNTAVRGYTGEVYGIDRWCGRYGGDMTAVICDGYIEISRSTYAAHLRQYSDMSLAGETVTVSVLCSRINAFFESTANGVDYTSVKNMVLLGSDELSLLTFTLTVPNDSTGFCIALTTAETNQIGKIAAVKLELGSTQTLAHQDENGNWVLNEIPDYTTELLKCKRYYRRCGIGLYMTTQATNTFIINFPFDVPMRTAPVANFIRTNFKLYSAMAANSSITVTDPNIIVSQLCEKGVNAIGFQATLSAAFEDKMLYRFNSDYDIIELSADL